MLNHPMSKIHSFFKNNWEKFVMGVLFTGCFGLFYFFCNQILSVSAEPNSILSTDVASVPSFSYATPNTTFLKSYRLLALTKINGVWPTKDGGYIISGTTDPNVAFIPPDGFVAKLDKQGNISWMKLLKSTNSAGVGNSRGDEDVQSIIELKNGGYFMASKVWGFITTAESSSGGEVNKILLTRLDKNGNMIWNKSLTASVEDAKNSLVETDDGFLFHANMLDLAPSKRGEDSAVYMDMPFASLKVLKLDKNGNLLWSKNIKNFIARENDSYFVATADGGYALAGNIAETNPEKKPPYNFDTYPGLAKFDKNFNFQWAKSMEGTPMEMATAIPQEDGGYKMGWKKWRQGAMAVHGFVQTQDNGYLILGNLSGLSMLSDSFNLKNGVKNWMMGFKFDSSGDLEWVKKITFGFNEFTSPMMKFSMTVTDDNQIMVAGPLTWAEDDYHAQIINANAQRDLYCAKYQISEEKCKGNQIENIKDNAQTEQDWEKVQALYTAIQESFRPGVFMMKVDDQLNTSWAKIINPKRGVANYALTPTVDSGVVIAGEYTTNVVRTILFGEKIYYTDGFFMKLDASGNVKDDENWIINFNGKFVTELMTPYAVTNDLVVKAEPFKIKLTSRKPEFSLYKKAKTTTYAPFNISENTLPPVAPAIEANNTPLLNSTITSTAPRSWPQINYEKAVPSEPINDKSRILNSELLPILNQLYSNQVKLTDNLSGQMLSYIFGRVITKDDVTAVKNYLVGIGYKTQDEGNNQLTMYKPGYFLILSFSVDNLDKAFLDVTY
ncbi:MAG: hypothetical protein WCT11_01040 [Candidatus Magasanikbacteria bacterium]